MAAIKSGATVYTVTVKENSPYTAMGMIAGMITVPPNDRLVEPAPK